MIQEIGVFVLVALAFGFLVKKFFWKPKSANACDKDSCGCH
ncbi:FeoB-associated Cys-rich membrane protein [Urechidicola sp. KH5]